MDSQSSQFIIGLFVIAGIIGTFVFGLWLAGTGNDKETVPYTIYFEESVSGLKIGSRVSYRGIRIGFVSEIGIKADNPQFVYVQVNVEEQYKLHEGDVASLKLEGITGTSYINIEGARQGTPVIESSGETPTVIPSQKSELEQVVQGIPDLINQATILANRFAELLNEKNREQVEAILVNVNTLAESLAGQDQNIENLLTTINTAGEEFISLSDQLRDTAGRVDGFVDRLDTTVAEANEVLTNDVTKLIAEWQETAGSLRTILTSFNRILETNEESIEHFSHEGLKEFTHFLQEARILVASMSRVLESLESSGARFLLDQHVPEINTE